MSEAIANASPWRELYDNACGQLLNAKAKTSDALARAEAAEKERDALRAQLDAATAERDSLRMMDTFGERTGPTAFERNQLRDELAELRPQVDDLRAKLASAEHRAAMHERDADEAHRAVAVLSTMFRAAIEAVAKGVR